MKKWTAIVFVALVAAAGAQARLVLDQQQTTLNLGTSGEGLVVGGDYGYQLGQTVTAGIDGRLARVEIAAVCESGTVTIEIRDVAPGDPPGTWQPGTTVLTQGTADASMFPPSGGFVFRPIDLDHPVRMSAGDQYAIVVKNETGQCGVAMGPSIDNYAGGRSVFRYRFLPPDTWIETGGLADPVDMAFKTWVEVGPPPGAGFQLCTVGGFGPLPIPAFTPLCRCVQDASLREARCGLFHPSFFLYRTIPSPIERGATFEVKWTLVPLESFDGIVTVDDVLPPGFQGTKSPLVFFGSQVPAGQSLTLSYEAVAGQKGGKFKVESNVTFAPDIDKPQVQEGAMKTVIEVSGK